MVVNSAQSGDGRINTFMASRSFKLGLGSALLIAGIAGNLLMPARSLSQSEKSTTATHLFVHRDAAEKLEPSATTVSRVMLTANQTNGRYSVIDETFQPGMKSPSHKHGYHSETFIVLAGTMKWTVGGETDTIGAGDLVYIPPDTSHWAEVVGDEPVRAIMLYEPGGYEIGLRQRAASRREGGSGGVAGPGDRPRRAPNPYADFIPDVRPQDR